MLRRLIHLDADAFFASVEQAADPRLRGKPVAVGGEKRGIIAAASYEARRYGIYTPMPTVRARRLCPNLILLPGDFEKYERFSRWMFSYAYDFTPDVEITSIDEGYLDLTTARRPVLEIAHTIRRAIGQSLKITVSEGLGTNKLVSQIASKLNKPAAFVQVPDGREIPFLHPLPNRWLPGVGPHTASRLTAAGLARIGQIAATPPEMLQLLLGQWAVTLREFANGMDDRPLVPVSAPAQSYGHQETFGEDQTDETFLEATLRRMADSLMAKVRADDKSIRTLTVKVRYNDMDEDQCSESLSEPTDLESDLYPRLRPMLRRAWKRRVSLRLVSLRLSNVYGGLLRAELPLEERAQQHETRRRLAGVVDELRHHRGRYVIMRGHDLVLRDQPVRKENEPKMENRSRTPNPGLRTPDLPPAFSESRRTRPSPPAAHRPPPTALPLAVHSYFSFLDSTLSIDAIIAWAVRHRLPAVALTDQGNLHGAVEFTQKAQAAGLRPILGVELRVQEGPLWLYVQDAEGYRNLCRGLSNLPRPDRETPDAGKKNQPRKSNRQSPNAGGTSNGEEHFVPSGNWDLATWHLAFPDTAGLLAVSPDPSLASRFPGRFYRAVRSPDELKRLDRWNTLPVVAVQPVHYAAPADRWKFDIVQSIRTLTLLREEHPAKRSRGEYHFLSPEEMARLFRDHPDVLERTAEIPDRCPFVMPFNPPQFPPFRPPDNSTPRDFLRQLVFAGFQRRYGGDSSFSHEAWQGVKPGSLSPRSRPRAWGKRTSGERSHSLTQPLQREIRNAKFVSVESPFPDPPLTRPPDPSRRTPPPPSSVADLDTGFENPVNRPTETSALRNVRAQIEEELRIIHEVGYEEYFLVVWNLLRECRRHGIEWITRGSAADSLVCYCLGISDVCPVRFGLYFRRFLNKERMSMHKLPDIDVDFPHDRKDDVVDLVLHLYGTEHAAVVGGFSTFQARSAFAEIAKVLGVAERDVRKFTEHFPWRMPKSEDGRPRAVDRGRGAEVRGPGTGVRDQRPEASDPEAGSRGQESGVKGQESKVKDSAASALGPPSSAFQETLRASPDCRDLPLDEEPYRSALEMAVFLDGFPRYPKMHPCGVVLSRQPMHALTPTFVSSKGYPTTHFDMDAVEAIGLVKIDILAQGGLAAMRDVRDMLRERGLNVDLIRFRLTSIQGADKEPPSAPLSHDESDFSLVPRPVTPYGVQRQISIHREATPLWNSASGPHLFSTGETMPLPILSENDHSVGRVRPGEPKALDIHGDAAQPEASPHHLQAGYTPRFDDPEVWDMISSGGARAVHHIESPAMVGLCRMCHVRDIDGLIAIVSVIRPGAANELKKVSFARRYQGLEPTTYPHPSLEPFLKSTFGMVVYEEHILQICEAFAGLPLGRADTLRRALVKQNWTAIMGLEHEFKAAARQRHHDEPTIERVWNLVEGFIGYAFCKAHSTAYGVEAYQSAWLKRYFPAQFMAAVLTNGKGFYHPLVYILECHRLGIPILPPCVNDPGPAFTVVENGARPPAVLSAGTSPPNLPAIRVPATRVKGLTDRTKDRMVEERARGPFASLRDFYRRVGPLPEEMEALLRAGACDGFGQARTDLFWETQYLQHAYGHDRKQNAQGWLIPPPDFRGTSARGGRLPSPPATAASSCDSSASSHQAETPSNVTLTEPTRRQRLEWEQDLLDFTVTDHPLALHDDVAWETYCPVNRLGEHIGRRVVTCGLVIEQRIHHQATGEPMKFLTLADWTGMVETELFAATYRSYGLATVRYPVLEISATVEPFENGRGFTLRVHRAGRPRLRRSGGKPAKSLVIHNSGWAGID